MAALMTVPNLIVAGSQKSGTTSLCAALEQHPNCYLSNPKEPNFFSRAVNEQRLASFSRCFRGVPDDAPVVVDGTTTYMADPAIAERIYRLLGPDTKFIFALRSPRKRAYSGFLHMLKRGHERRTAQEAFLSLPDDPVAAVQAERANVEVAAAARQVVAGPYVRQYDDVLWNFRYLTNSLFADQIEPFERLFGQDNILILLFEDMVADFMSERARIAAFLDIPEQGLPQTLPRENQTRMPDTGTLWGRIDEQLRRIKRGNFVFVRKAEGQAPSRAPSDVDGKLTRLTDSEVTVWEQRLGRDLRTIGW